MSTRRTLLRLGWGGGLALLGGAWPGRPALAQATRPGAHAELLKQIANGRAPRPERVRLQIPDIADNGASVPVTVAVESPMTAADHVTAIHLVTDDNPAPEVMTVRLTPACGRAEVAIRIRLAKSMNVIAYAETSDGRLWSARRAVTVTIGGCGG